MFFIYIILLVIDVNKKENRVLNITNIRKKIKNKKREEKKKKIKK